MAQSALYDIHYQVQLLRASAVQESWIMIIQSGVDMFSIAGSGNCGFHEFLPYLMPDLTCYILLLTNVPVVSKSKDSQQAVLIAYQGVKSLFAYDCCFSTVASPQFKVIFQPYSLIIYSHSQEALQKQLHFDTTHPSYKSLFYKLPMGFQVLTAKERHLQPYTTSLLQVNTRETEKIFETVRKPAELSKQLKRKQTRPNAQIYQMIKSAQEQAEQLGTSSANPDNQVLTGSDKSPARVFYPQNDFSDVSDPEIDDSDLMKYMSSLPNQSRPTPKRPTYARAKIASSQAKKTERQSKIAKVYNAPAEELRIDFTQVVVDSKSGRIVPVEQNAASCTEIELKPKARIIESTESSSKNVRSASNSTTPYKMAKKPVSSRTRFEAHFYQLQDIIPRMQNEKKRKYNVTLATAVEHCIGATQGEMPERTKTVYQALARVSLQEVVMLGIQNGSSVTNLAEALAVLHAKLPARKFEILKLVTASSKSLNTEEVCLGYLAAWVEYLNYTE